MRKLTVLTGRLEGTGFALVDPQVAVGRADENQIVLEEGGTSRHHAILVREGGDYRIRDLNSSNGTYVNDQRVTDARLRPGDRVRLGTLELRYEEAPAVHTTVAAPPAVPQPLAGPGRAAPTISAATPAPAPASARAGAAPVALPAALPVGPPARHGWPVWQAVVLTTALCWVIGGGLLWFCGIIPPRSHTERPATPVPAPVAMPPAPAPTNAVASTPAPTAVSRPQFYENPTAGVRCRVPAGWQVRESKNGTGTVVSLLHGGDELRIGSIASDRGELADADREAFGAALRQVVDQVRPGGGEGQVGEVTWRTVAGWRVLQAEVTVERPQYLWMRQARYRRAGREFTVAAYTDRAEEREPVIAAFEALLTELLAN